MFGHDDNQKQPKDTTGIMPAVVPDPIVTAGLNGSSPAPSTVFGAPTGAPVVPDTPAFVASTPDAADSSDSTPANEDLSASVSLHEGDDSSKTDDATPATDTSPADDDLMNLKQQALQQLSPLVGQLDQTPEEKFRTTMMMIQASDDKSLVKTAFESAQKITDDKARAQALLDVINEINYFTQHKSE